MSRGSRGEIRVAFAVNGDPRAPTTQSGVARHLLAALERREELAVQPLDLSLSTPERLAAAATTFRIGTDRWRWALHGGRAAVRARTRRLRRKLRDGRGGFDVVLQLRTVYDTLPLPYVAYVDNTVDVAARHWPPAAPWRGRSLTRALAREQRYFGGAAHVFATGNLVRDSLVEAYGVAPERVTVVGAGSHFTPDRAGAAGPRKPWVLFVGFDFHRKGGDRLVEAFERVVAEVPEARLKVVGPAASVRHPNVDVLGPVRDRAQLAQLYEEARVFALPARYEPYGVAFLEAMAHGLPCVGTDVGAIPEIIEDGVTGIVVAAGDADALSRALLALLSDPDRATAMGEAGRARVAEELNWDRVAARMTAVLGDLVAERVG